MAQSYTRRITLWINDKEVRNDIASIRKEMMKLQAQQSRMIVGSKEYNAAGKKIRDLRGVMQQHNAQLRTTQNNWFSLRKAAEKFNRYFMLIGTVVASITGVIMGFRKARDEAMKFEERLDNLSALTGLAGKELEWLGKTAKETSVEITGSGIRIKQAGADILDAYTKVGSQRPELLKNKEALHAVTKDAIILSEAAKSDLQPAVAGLTMAMNQFNLPAAESRRIINAMAAGSKEGAGDIPYLTQAIEKSGTTLNLMNVSLEENIGLIETIAPNYTQASEAGNSLDKVFLKLKAEQIGYKDGVFSVSAALEELSRRFASGESSVDLFGLRHAKMAELLVMGRHEVDRYTKAVTGTEMAIEQAVKNTNNNAAKLAQARNKLNLILIEFGEKLNPAFVKSTNLVTYLIKALMKAPQWFSKNEVLILALAGAVVTYNHALITQIALQTKSMALKAKDMIADKLQVITINAKAIATRVMVAVTGKATMAQKRMIVTQRTLNASMSANPAGLVIAALSALVVAIKAYDKYSRQAREREEERKKAIEDLDRVSKDYNEVQETLQKGINNLNRMSRERKEALQDEINKTIELAQAELLLQKAKQEEIKQQNTQATLWQKTMAVAKYGTLQWGKIKQKISEQAKENGLAAAAELEDGIDALEEKIAAFKRQGMDLEEIINAESIADAIGTGTITELEEKLNKYQTALKNTVIGSEEYLRIQQKINEVEQKLNKTRGESGGFESTQKALEAAFAREQNLLKQQLLEKKITQSEYNREQYALELAHLSAMRELYRRHGEDVIVIEGKIIDKKLAWQREMEKMLEVSTSITENLLQEERKMFADIDAEMDKHLNDYYKKLDDETDATIKAEIKKKEAYEAAREAAIRWSVESGMAAVETAETMEEAGRAILNTIRDIIKGYLAEAVAAQAKKIFENLVVLSHL